LIRAKHQVKPAIHGSTNAKRQKKEAGTRFGCTVFNTTMDTICTSAQFITTVTGGASDRMQVILCERMLSTIT